jgi:hypothetical protein
MNRVTTRLALRGCFLLAMVWPLQTLAGVDGNYQGEYRGQKVTAVLETMSTTVTGVMGIGTDSYLLRAEAGQNTIPGQLNNLKSGEALKLLIKPKGSVIDVEVTPKSADVMRFTLRRSQ